MKVRLNRIHFPVTTLGPGRRVGIWMQGCSIGCRGCLSRDTWDPDPSMEVPVDEVLEICRRLAPEGPNGITISGGEPFEQPDALAGLLAGIADWRADLGRDLDVLCYSGLPLGRLRADFAPLLRHLDGVVPEPFLVDRPAGGPWRGSRNQPLVPLSPLGGRLYEAFRADSAEPGARRLQVDVSGDRIWFIGIPGRGDLERHREELAAAGIAEMGVWRP